MKDLPLSNDLFEIAMTESLTDVGVEVLTDLYMPIIGAEAVGLYLKLVRLAAEEGELASHDRIFEGTLLSPGDFFEGRKNLEAIGLLSTKMLGEQGEIRVFRYELFVPIDAKVFLKNPLLSKALKQSTSSDYVSAMKKRYKLTKKESIKGTDISANFTDVFQVGEDLDISLSGKLRSGSKGGRIKTYLDIDAVLAYLREKFNPEIDGASFSRDELSRVEMIAVKYNYSDEATADLLIPSINMENPFGERIDFAHFEKVCKESQGMRYLKRETAPKTNRVIRGQTDEAVLLRQMNELTAEEFLAKRQNGARLVQSDRALIEYLRTELLLPDPVISALLDYVLEKQDNQLPPRYVEKVAGSLARCGFDNAVDAYNYLHKPSKGSKTAKAVAPKAEDKPEEKPAAEEDAPSFDELMRMMREGK